jgi:hypothetical protein
MVNGISKDGDEEGDVDDDAIAAVATSNVIYEGNRWMMMMMIEPSSHRNHCRQPKQRVCVVSFRSLFEACFMVRLCRHFQNRLNDVSLPKF